MKVSTPQITLHPGSSGKNDPILSLDFHPNLMVMVTCGTDKEIKLWNVDPSKQKDSPMTFIFGLQAHESSVNAVKFAPNGKLLASCSDDGRVSIFSLENDASWESLCEERQICRKTLRGHTSDICDIAWSRDSKYIISGSVDGTCIFWNVETRKPIQNFDDHGHYVQGVAWDPYQHYFCSASADRTVKMYKVKGKELKYDFTCDLSRRIYSMKENIEQEIDNERVVKSVMKKKSQQIFSDDTLTTFFRRLCWSPDGLLLFVPAGQYRDGPKGPISPTTYVYVRGKWESPAIHLPGASKASVAVKCNPVLFRLIENGPKPWGASNYRVVFAVATLDSILVYDTQHLHPIAIAVHLHFAQMTDMSWAADGKTLIVSSNDGYCSIFHLNDIGEPLDESIYPEISKKYISNETISTEQCATTPERNQLVSSGHINMLIAKPKSGDISKTNSPDVSNVNYLVPRSEPNILQPRSTPAASPNVLIPRRVSLMNPSSQGTPERPTILQARKSPKRSEEVPQQNSINEENSVLENDSKKRRITPTVVTVE